MCVTMCAARNCGSNQKVALKLVLNLVDIIALPQLKQLHRSYAVICFMMPPRTLALLSAVTCKCGVWHRALAICATRLARSRRCCQQSHGSRARAAVSRPSSQGRPPHVTYAQHSPVLATLSKARIGLAYVTPTLARKDEGGRGRTRKDEEGRGRASVPCPSHASASLSFSTCLAHPS